MSVPCELAPVQHASLVAKRELAALGDLRVRIVFDLERKIVNLCTLRPARNLLRRKPGLTAMHVSHAAWKNRFVRVDHLARTALQREEKSAHLIWNLTRRFVQEKDAHGPAYRVAYGKFVALAEGLLVEHVLRGVESTCEFIETTKDDPEDTRMHTIQGQSNGNSESSRNAVMEAGTIQQPDSTLDERPENRPSPNTFTALDTRQVCRKKSLICSETLSTISNGNPLSDLSKSPSLDGSDSDKGAHPASLIGCSSHGELLDVLPNCQMIDCLIERYFESISTVKLVYQTF
jgi:hypothetical protein